MCIHYLGHPPYLPPQPPGRTCSALLLSNFVEEKNIKDNKKNVLFLLMWDMDSYTGRFFVLFLCTCVLQPTLVHLYQTSSLLPSPLSHSGLGQFKIIIFTPIQWVHQPHSSFWFPSLSLFLPCMVYCNCFRSVILIWGRMWFLASEPD
jgi:hypothetical protein